MAMGCWCIRPDLKVTSHKQPQSSCPYKSARQKIYGLGYSLLVFVYDKTDDEEARTARLNILHTIVVTADRTADFQTTTGIRRIVESPLLRASSNTSWECNLWPSVRETAPFIVL